MEVANLGLGEVNVEQSVSLGRIGANYTNAGDFTLTNASAITTITGTSFTNLAGGTMAGIGEVDVNAVNFTSGGTIAPGLSAGELSLMGM